jgi:hypothetical protein
LPEWSPSISESKGLGNGPKGTGHISKDGQKDLDRIAQQILQAERWWSSVLHSTCAANKDYSFEDPKRQFQPTKEMVGKRLLELVGSLENPLALKQLMESAVPIFVQK